MILVEVWRWFGGCTGGNGREGMGGFSEGGEVKRNGILGLMKGSSDILM